MKERKVFLTKEQSLVLRGIAIIMVILSHYAEWYTDILTNEAFRYGLTRLGVYGVNIFFLASGYGLVKSVSRKKIGWGFLWNRVKNTYLPYLLIAGLIELYAGGIHTAEGWYKFLTGHDYWFIQNILLFYVIFFVVYKVTRKEWLRMVLLAAALFCYSWALVSLGRADFWHISNLSFMIGILLAQYEKKLLRGANFAYPLQLILLAAGMVWVTVSGMENRTVHQELTAAIRSGVIASGIWALFCAQAAGLFEKAAGFLAPAGKISLELYLSHMFIFYRILNDFTDLHRILQSAIALVITAGASWLINWMFSLLWSAVDTLNGRSRK